MHASAQFYMALILVFMLVVASAWDLRGHRIPNWLVLLGMLVGLSLQTMIAGLQGLGQGLQGTLVGFAIFLPLHIAGGMAAGDVKLMAMAGAFLDPSSAALASVCSLLFGSLGGLLIVIWRGQLGRFLGRYRLMLISRAYIAPEPGEVASQKFPYALAVLCGTSTVLLVGGS